MPKRLVVGTSGDAEKGEALQARLPLLRFGVLFGQIRQPLLLCCLFCKRPTEGGKGMTDALREKVLAFRTAMSVVKSMLSAGIIDHDDYVAIETVLAEKYDLTSSTIFR